MGCALFMTISRFRILRFLWVKIGGRPERATLAQCPSTFHLRRTNATVDLGLFTFCAFTRLDSPLRWQPTITPLSKSDSTAPRAISLSTGSTSPAAYGGRTHKSTDVLNYLSSRVPNYLSKGTFPHTKCSPYPNSGLSICSVSSIKGQCLLNEVPAEKEPIVQQQNVNTLLMFSSDDKEQNDPCIWYQEELKWNFRQLLERLAYSPPTKANRVQSLAGYSRIFTCGNRAGLCCWSVSFLGDLPFPPLSHSGTALYPLQSPSSAPKTLRLSRLNKFAHFNHHWGAAVAERLARSPPTKANRAQLSAGSSDFRKVGIVPDDVVGWRVFSGIYRFSPPPPPIPTAIGSQAFAFKSRPNLFTSLHFTSNTGRNVSVRERSGNERALGQARGESIDALEESRKSFTGLLVRMDADAFGLLHLVALGLFATGKDLIELREISPLEVVGFYTSPLPLDSEM
ncbi:hypothetical protein PR048_019959 [Dryococelus australis]|uniref:Uncharacterized protein n=1 Tax=Dryococelus australis TaxID=614101 RepID=A0ABQ9H557_9NEOP|nr:hypothetical protein PR048_019959 [Dryococelus australis]